MAHFSFISTIYNDEKGAWYRGIKSHIHKGMCNCHDGSGYIAITKSEPDLTHSCMLDPRVVMLL